MKALLEKLTAAFGPSGHEERVREIIAEKIAPFVDETRVDALGNLVALKHGTGRRVMLAAHMDQIGFVVTEADEHGFLRVHNVGYLRRPFALGRRVVFANGLGGVISREVEDDDPTDMTLQRLFIDIGATSREEALSKVSIGDMAVLRPEWSELLNGRVCASALDNRAGCALLIGALKALKGCPHEIAAVFTTQEEVGLRGARAAAYDVDPEVALALDVTPLGDTPKGERLPVKLGDGIAVKVMDNSVICAPAVVRALEDAAEAQNIPCQREVLTHGGTDAGAIHMTRGGVPSGVLSIPCRYVHSACEVISLADLEAGVRLLDAWLDRM